MPTRLPNPWKQYPVQWGVVAWIAGVHLLGILGTALYYGFFGGFRLATLALAAAIFFIYHISITAGTHRLFAHPTYKAVWGLQLFYVLAFAGTFQSSTLWWAVRHIEHHAHSDTEEDPYSIRHGFWWAHMIWVFFVPVDLPVRSRSLARNSPLLLWQHKHYYPLAIVMGLALPTLIASLWGDPVGGLIVGGFARLVVQYHATWTINSVSHTWGEFIYSVKRTARTNWLMAIVNVGEGYHERHHWAEDDFRLGPRWYNWDPGKWFILLCTIPGWAYDLKRVTEQEVLARVARLQQTAEA